MQPHNKASAWFDDLYKKHQDNHDNIPWARQDVNPELKRYLDKEHNHSGRALVIGCGLGDDAYALDRVGYDVLAIDVSQVALNLAKQRFFDSDVKFIKQDIFDMPQKYWEYFDFVYEALTIQSLPLEFRKKIIQAIAGTVAKNGKLLVVAHKHNGDPSGPPWPLTHEELDMFLTEGLQELSFELIKEDSSVSDMKFRILYQKPKN